MVIYTVKVYCSYCNLTASRMNFSTISKPEFLMPNVGIAIINHPPNHHVYGWYKPSNMGGLWHCYTHYKIYVLWSTPHVAPRPRRSSLRLPPGGSTPIASVSTPPSPPAFGVRRAKNTRGGGTINEDQRSMIGISWGDTNPRSSMYGIFTYIWVIYGVYVGKYTIHGWSGNVTLDVTIHV